MRCQIIFVVFALGLAAANEDYENKLTKLWSLSRSSSSDGSSIVNVTSASIVIQPSSYSNEQYVPSRVSRDSKMPYAYKQYAFKPRAIPLKRSEDAQDRSVYYTPDEVNKYKTEVLFPGNYIPIAKEKSTENSTQDSSYNPMEGGPFKPQAIPLLREQQYKRSLDDDEEPIIEKPAGFTEAVASRRSISDMFEVDDEDDDEEQRVEDEDEDYEEKGPHVNKVKRKVLKKSKKYAKYMLPLLLAYKLKYFALVPLLISGLVLLVGATGLAGFFFALFAAVMGLQKGGY